MSATMENVINVTDADFETTVLEESKNRPVVLDLWASWCGPCRTLGPILEKIADERAGAFLLAKMDVDANPMVSQAFGVQSIPTVLAFKDGAPVTGFVGAYPEDAVNDFVDGLLPTDAEVEAAEAKAEAEAGDVEGAEEHYREALADDPANKDAAVGLGRLLAERGELEEASSLIAPHIPDSEASKVASIVEVKGWAGLEGTGPLDAAKRLAAAGDYRDALAGMLALLAEEQDAARQAMVAVFDVLGAENALTLEYRRRLTAALF